MNQPHPAPNVRQDITKVGNPAIGVTDGLRYGKRGFVIVRM